MRVYLRAGAAGRFALRAAAAFRDAGWSSSSAAGRRPPRADGHRHQVESNRAVTVNAARETDMVLHALNLTYTEWAKHALSLAYVAIEAAETSGATLMVPGNVYNHGAGCRRCSTRRRRCARPRARDNCVVMEERMREASERGMRTIILRTGDFFGAGRGSWFDLVITKELVQGRVTYPGPFELVHEWAYLPDVAAAMVRLAAIRDTIPPFATFGFPGYAITGRELADEIR